MKLCWCSSRVTGMIAWRHFDWHREGLSYSFLSIVSRVYSYCGLLENLLSWCLLVNIGLSTYCIQELIKELIVENPLFLRACFSWLKDTPRCLGIILHMNSEFILLSNILSVYKKKNTFLYTLNQTLILRLRVCLSLSAFSRARQLNESWLYIKMRLMIPRWIISLSNQEYVLGRLWERKGQ